MLQKAIRPTTKALLEEVHQEEKKVVEILQQYNAAYLSITEQIRGTVAE